MVITRSSTKRNTDKETGVDPLGDYPEINDDDDNGTSPKDEAQLQERRVHYSYIINNKTLLDAFFEMEEYKIKYGCYIRSRNKRYQFIFMLH